MLDQGIPADWIVGSTVCCEAGEMDVINKRFA